MEINAANNAQSQKAIQESPEDKKLRKACADFEAVLLNYMFQSMKKTVPGDTLFGGGLQKDIYDSMYLQEVSAKIAHDQSMGIGDALYRQLQNRGAAGKKQED
jgi:peptidoglycan hydrolase FlgJ